MESKFTCITWIMYDEKAFMLIKLKKNNLKLQLPNLLLEYTIMIFLEK